MYSDVRKKRAAWIVLALAAALVLTALLIWDPGRDIGEESAAAIREAVRRSALQCYAVEGAYPPNLAYLEENYGLVVNTADFYVAYEAFASNLPPDVVVRPKH